MNRRGFITSIMCAAIVPVEKMERVKIALHPWARKHRSVFWGYPFFWNGIKFIVHRNDENEWKVTEPTTGLAAPIKTLRREDGSMVLLSSCAETRRQAEAGAKKSMEIAGLKKVKECIKNQKAC